MKKKVGVRVLSLLLSCVLLGTMLPAAGASADPADPTYSITVAPPSIDLVEGDEGELTAKVVSESTDGTKTELDDAGLAAAGLSIRWESKDKGRVSVESPNTLTTKVMAVKTGETTDEKKVTITAYLNSGTDDIGKASCEITVKENQSGNGGQAGSDGQSGDNGSRLPLRRLILGRHSNSPPRLHRRGPL